MSELKTHWKKCFDKDYLGSCDLPDGKDLIVTISHVETKEIKGSGGRADKRNVATFATKIKPMILNATNCKIIKKFTGSPFIEDWKNVAVSIYVDNNVEAFGEITEGLRIRPKQPNQEKPELTPEHDLWSNAVEYLSKPNNAMSGILKRYKVSKENQQKLMDTI